MKDATLKPIEFGYYYLSERDFNQEPRVPVYRDRFTVDMNNGKYASESDGRLKTYGLGGCNVTLVYARGSKKHGIITHYDTLSLADNVRKLTELVSGHPEIRTAGLKKAVILHEDMDGRLESEKEFSERTLQFLEASLKEILGDDVQIKRRDYSGSVSAGEGHREVFLVVRKGYWSSFIGGESFE